MSIERRSAKHGVVYDVRLRAPDGRAYKRTFRTRREAETFEARERADRSRGGWVDPRAGSVTLADYASRWLEDRPRLRIRTRELYEGQLRHHVLPGLGKLSLAELTTARVRSWHAGLLRAGRPGPVTVAKCYRLLRTILGTAVEDGLIVKNPCVIKDAGVERSPERPIATVAQVYALADALGGRYRVLVLLATFTGLQLGELLALTRQRVDLLHGTVTVTEQLQELAGGSVVVGPPKTHAGLRTVALPAFLLPELEAHLDRWAAPGLDGLLFVGEEGGPLRRGVLQRHWRAAARQVGLPDLHFHDLRHTGNTLAAATGASTKELMARMGHASPQAALRYQHATAERDVAIAAALHDLVAGSRPAGVVPLRASTNERRHADGGGPSDAEASASPG
ncbi:MAG: tyrosine-type recombinase/integrase [Acidimicrobiales bacterium]